MKRNMPMQAVREQQHRTRRKNVLFLLIGIICIPLIIADNSYASEPQTVQEPTGLTYKKDDQMKKRVLIVYASRAGSTGEVARIIGQALGETGASVDVYPITDANDLNQYQAIIVGSAIRVGKWLPEAAEFVKKHRDKLSRVPAAYFVVCNTMKDDTPENRKKVLAYLDPVRKAAPDIKPVDIGLFAGVIDFSKLSFMDKSMLRMKGVSEGDYRDWAAIKKWGTDVASMLLGK